MSRLFARRELRIAETQLRFALGDRPDACTYYRALALRTFCHVSESIAEFFIINRLLADHRLPAEDTVLSKPVSIITPDEGQLELFRRAKNGENFVLLGGHFGNFELHVAYVISQGIPVFAVASKPNYGSVENALSSFRTAYGIDIIWRKSRKGAVVVREALRKGLSGAFLLDQDTSLENIFSPFFGLDAASPVAPLRIALNLNTPIYSCFLYRKRRLEHYTSVREIKYDPADPLAEEKIISAYNEHLESLIREYPEQWGWWHRRWRRRPGIDYRTEGKPRTTDQYLQWLETIRNQHEENETAKRQSKQPLSEAA